MTEVDARDWLGSAIDVPRETLDLITRFLDFLRCEAARHNLIAASTINHLWSRHVVDSAQLVPLAAAGPWIDLGSGAGFPGLIAAVLRPEPTTLVESRRKRAEFLRASADLLNIAARASIIQGRAETIDPAPYATISARAFAPLDALFTVGQRFVGPDTRWILPKGRGAQAELDMARRTWQGDFRIHPSITDPDSAIIVAERVRPRTKR